MESLPLSLLNDYLYCPRRAALKVVEGWRSANEHTARGDIVHEHADLPGYELAKGVTLLRALPVWSERLGLNGKCDIVEVHAKLVAAEVTRLTSPAPQLSTVNPQSPVARKSEPPNVGCYDRLVPVEFKLGKRRQWENDDAQLCAQALCLEEMFNVSISRGAVFHADSKRRREVEFTIELRQRTEAALQELHALLNDQRVPAAVFKPACEECSLYEICLPKATAAESRAGRLARQLFQI
ncbi:MAG: CRISPR-associated protein Cas4 [Verrucomicrobia bacterium]|nr:CRISPR-associated protein Cas4 [Verrucomicrobiota bacterium]